MLMFPKSRKRKPKPPRPIARRTPIKPSKKRIAARGTFKGFYANGKRCRRRTDYQVLSHAEICRQDRLRNRTRGELAFEAILRDMGIRFVSEKIFQNGDRYILVDFFLPDHKLALEVDGSAHVNQVNYDLGRDKWLLQAHGVRTVRFSNALVLKNHVRTREIIAATLA